ncbi:MAG TPA: hypothetical protein VGP26_16940 [Actinophytocola sp.]|jgi:hypothetical protein|nr:hypothetical protein [Actinophytocola sp.]
MRIITVCDYDGNVVALMSMPHDGFRPSLPGLPPGQQEVEIDVPDLTEDMNDEDRHSRLHELATRYRVDVGRKGFTAR